MDVARLGHLTVAGVQWLSSGREPTSTSRLPIGHRNEGSDENSATL